MELIHVSGTYNKYQYYLVHRGYDSIVDVLFHLQVLLNLI